MTHNTGRAALVTLSGITYILPELVAVGSTIAGLSPEDVFASPGSHWAVLTCPKGCCRYVVVSWNDAPKTRWEFLGEGRVPLDCESREVAEAFASMSKGQELQ